jgi:CBS domain-containing protein/sporulation protein YlmC with PRC-barrel domain
VRLFLFPFYAGGSTKEGSGGAAVEKPQEIMFTFLSLLLGRKAFDAEGAVVGKVHDLVAAVAYPYPRVERLVIARNGSAASLCSIEWSRVEIGDDLSVRLRAGAADLAAYADTAAEGVLRLRGDLLDRQIVDTAGRKVVRVNDVHLMRANGEVRVAHIDVGVRGMVRRIGLERAIDLSVRAFLGRGAAYLKRDSFVSWKNVELLSKGPEVRPAAPAAVETKLHDIHPAELAEIIEDLDARQREKLFQSLDSETAAEALSEVDDPKIQETLLESVDKERAADILEEMAPDEAADLLAEMPEEKADELIGKMDVEEATTVKELLQHEEDTAGGLMTTEFIDIRLGMKVRDIYGVLRREAREAELIYYLYVVDAEGKLAGVVTLKNLILADPERTVDEVMAPDPAAVRVDDGLNTVAEITTKYSLMAVPVVDAERRLKGVITIDDVFDMVLETGWRRKLTKGLSG